MISLEATADALNRYSITYDKTIHQGLRQGMVSEGYATPVATDHTYTAANITQTDIIQAYQCSFTPKGDTTLDAVDNPVQDIKVDIQLTCDDLEEFRDSWMVEWYEIGKSLKEWTFPRYMYEMVYVPKMAEELESIAYNGSYLAPTVDVAGNTINAVDGWGTKIAAAIVAGDLTPIAVGALVPTTMVAQVETFHEGLPEVYKNAPGNIYMSPANARAYAKDWRAKYGQAVGNENNDNLSLDVFFSNKKIVGLPSMAGSNRFIYSLPGNMIWGKRRGQASLPTIRWQEFERTLKGLAEFSRLFGFKHWANVFVSDQA